MANVKIIGMFHVKHLCKCGCVFMKSGVCEVKYAMYEVRKKIIRPSGLWDRKEWYVPLRCITC